MTASEAYLEAQRRIRAAKQTGQHWLDLGDIDGLEAIPEEFGELTELRELGVGIHRYDEQKRAWEWDVPRIVLNHAKLDLTSLAETSTLMWLDLSRTKPSDLSPLSKLKLLQYLDLRHTGVSSLSALADLKNLTVLHLERCPISNLAPIAVSTSLEALYLTQTQVNDLAHITHLTSLESLYLNDTNVGDLTPLVNLTNLRSLSLSCSNVSNIAPIENLTNLQYLDLSFTSVRNLSPLKRLSALQRLDLSSSNVSDLIPLANLRIIQSLDLSCTDTSDLSPLAGLSSLNTLLTSWCTRVTDWKAFANHPELRSLYAWDMEEGSISLDVANTLRQLGDLRTNKIIGVPPEVLSEHQNDNCLPRLRAWQDDLVAGEEKDQEVKVFVLGNGTAGKTQLCRRLRGLGFDASIPSTHAVQFTELEVMPDAGSGAVKARLWDFGGQDIYHGTHALFLEGRAVFVLVWNPEVEAKGSYEEGGLSLHHHSLTYWLDYVRSLAGEDAAIVVAQAQCDRETDRATPPLPVNHGFQRPPAVVTCSAKLGEIDELKAALRSATRYLLEVHGSYRMPTSWVVVKERLRELRLTQKTVARDAFEELCRDTHGTSVPGALLTYLHRCGEVFYKESLFKDEIVLDQEWAVRAIYAVLDRLGACQQLSQMGGVFPAGLLNTLAWQGEYTVDEQETLVGMMQSCSIAFPLSYSSDFSARWMAVPDLLPLEKDVQDRVQALWHEGVAVETVTLEYDFLHDGILREFLCQIGRQGGTNAAYWRYGCCFYDAKTHSRARVRARLNATPEKPGRGVILIETCEGQSSALLKQVQQAILNIRLGPKPRVVRPEGATETSEHSPEPSGPLQESLNIQPAPTEKPLVYLSYAWGGEKEKLVDRLEARLIREGYDVRRDKHATRPGDWLSEFMREIGRAERLCVVLSQGYLESYNCMQELCFAYDYSQRDKARFLSQVIPLVLEDAHISQPEGRMTHADHWQKQVEKIEASAMSRGFVATAAEASKTISMQIFRIQLPAILNVINDCLFPRGMANIEKDDFAAVLEALKRKG